MLRTLEDIVSDEFSLDKGSLTASLAQYAGQVFDGMRLLRISEVIFEHKHADIKIVNGFGAIPPDFYKERDAKEGGPGCCNWLEHSPFQDDCDEFYTFSIKLCKVQTNMCNGTLRLFYYGIPTDENGFPMITEEHGIDMAIKSYLRFVNTKARYYAGEVGIERFQVAEKHFHDISADVRGDAKMPPPAGYRRMVRLMKNS